MIKHLIACAALVLCSLVSTSFGQVGGFAIKSINVGTPKSPEIPGADIKRYTPGTWIELEVEFSSNQVLTPELEFKYYLLLGGQCLTGDITHVNVPAGQSLFSVMYVPPRTVGTLLKGQPFSPAAIQNVAVQIMKPGAPQPLAEKVLKPGPLFYRTMQQVPGMLVTKAETPFAHFWWDRYESIKPGK